MGNLKIWDAVNSVWIYPGVASTDFTIGPVSSANNSIAAFNGTTGKLLKDSGVSVDTDSTLAANSDTKIATQKAVKSYIDAGSVAAALDTDGTLAANSDTKVASQKATKTYADTKALDSNTVHKTGAESIAGAKTFTSAVMVDNASGSSYFGGFGGSFLNMTKTSGDAQPAIQLYAADQSISFGAGGSTALDIKVKRTGVNQLDFGSAKLKSVTDPASAQDVATKNYVDSHASSVKTINAQTGTSYTFVLGDKDAIVSASNSSAQTYTIPLNSSVAYPVGTQLTLAQIGTGAVTAIGSAGVTVNGVSAGSILSAQYQTIILYKTATDTWQAGIQAPTGGSAPRVNTITAVSNVYTIDPSTTDLAIISSPSANFTVTTTGSPLPKDGQSLQLRIVNGATGYKPTWNSVFASSGLVTLPSTAYPNSKTNLHGFTFDATAVKWVLTALDAVGY